MQHLEELIPSMCNRNKSVRLLQSTNEIKTLTSSLIMWEMVAFVTQTHEASWYVDTDLITASIVVAALINIYK